MMHPTGIGPSSNVIPHDVSIRDSGRKSSNVSLDRKFPFDSKGWRDDVRYASGAPESTQRQLAQKAADQSTATSGAGAPSAGQEQLASKQSQSGNGQDAQSGKPLNQFMKFLHSIGEAFGNIGRMFMGGFGSVANMAMSLFSLAANSARSMIRM
ncbi:hypothetical protein [Burkholderia ubonensis]|uniref:hypothetical protein n=1 Tax=Burkholderia ubonensis TaxID=101571 RepID=UPI0012F79217|nr:hypothetical protein [Burkholderia ubonensis]